MAAPLISAVVSIVHEPKVLDSNELLTVLSKDTMADDVPFRLCRPCLGFLELYLLQMLQDAPVECSTTATVTLAAAVDIIVIVASWDSPDAAGQAALTLFRLTGTGPAWTAPVLVRAVIQLATCVPSGSHSLQPLLAAVFAQARQEARESGATRSHVIASLPFGSYAKLPVALAIFSNLHAMIGQEQRQKMVDVLFAAQHKVRSALNPLSEGALTEDSMPAALVLLTGLLDVPLGSADRVPLGLQQLTELGRLLVQHPFNTVARVVARLAQRSLLGLIAGTCTREGCHASAGAHVLQLTPFQIVQLSQRTLAKLCQRASLITRRARRGTC
jgi:hypothetical protein